MMHFSMLAVYVSLYICMACPAVGYMSVCLLACSVVNLRNVMSKSQLAGTGHASRCKSEGQEGSQGKHQL